MQVNFIIHLILFFMNKLFTFIALAIMYVFTIFSASASTLVDLESDGNAVLDYADMIGANDTLLESKSVESGIDGVYMVDSLNCPSVKITGAAMKDARELYGTNENGEMNERLSKYLDGKTQKNEVVSQVNGRLVILGLKDGDYYLVETDPPSGYNALREHKEITVDKNSTIFTVFANEDGQVADIQQTDGVFVEKNYSLTTLTVQNSKGDELPSTGAEGTFWMITIGTFLAIGFAIFLITHKKMSVYTD